MNFSFNNTQKHGSGQTQDSFRRIGNFVLKYRVIIIILWFLIAVSGFLGARHITSVLRGEGSNAPGTETYKQEILLRENFENQYLQNVIYTFSSKKLTFKNPAYKKYLKIIEETIQTHPNTGWVIDYDADATLLSPDGYDTFLLVGLDVKNFREAESVVEEITKKVKSVNLPSDIKIHATGNSVFSKEMGQISAEDGAQAEKRVIPIVLIILILSFGSIIAACLPLIIGIISCTLTLACLYVIGQFVEITTLSLNFTTMIGLGVGIDYSLLIVNRFREELDKNITVDEAILNTVCIAGKAVTYSGLAVCVGLIGLLIPNLPIIYSFGITGLLVVLITICLSITFLPALLSVIGKYINAPVILTDFIKHLWENKLFWASWAKAIMKRPGVFLISSMVFLIFISSFVLHIKLWNSSISLMPDRLESKQGFMVMTKIDKKQKYPPISITFETKNKSFIWSKKNVETLYNFTKEIMDKLPIVKIVGMINSSSKLSLDDYLVISNYIGAYGSIANMKLLGMGNEFPFISTDEKKTVIWINRAPDADDSADWDTVRDLRKYRDSFMKNHPEMNILIGGIGAVNVDFKDSLYSQFPLIIGFIIISTFLIILISFQSFFLALKSVVLNIISVTASFGWLVLVFQYGITANIIGVNVVPGALLVFTPVVLFCIIFGLSMDYEIFLLSRIKEEYELTGNTELAIANGLQKTGGIITNAALIMIIVFEAFTFAEIIIVKEIGLGLATAVLIDATIIRIILVPAIMRLLGDWCWWLPKGLKKFINNTKTV